MNKLIEICQDHNILIHGIIDSDYHGNTAELFGISVIDTETVFAHLDRLDYYKTNFNFFCATNWSPEDNPIQARNRQKRHQLIDLIDQHQLNCVSLVDKNATVSKFATIGHDVYIDVNCNIQPDCVIHNHVSLNWGCGIAHHTVIERNCVIRDQAWTSGYCQFEPDCFIGVGVKALKNGTKFGQGTWIQEMVYIRRGTVKEEVVGRNTPNQRRVTHQV